MADQYGLFWNSISGDRIYDADSFAEWLNKFFTTGVFNGELEVVADSGMVVDVTAGYANINGKVRFFEQPQAFTLDPASGVYPRIDTIVIRSDSANRIITTEYVKGEYSGLNPVATPPTRTGGLYEIVLAEIYVSAGATQILSNDITDKRADDSVCGWVTSTVESVPMDQIVSQMTAQFMTWFDEMKDQLSEDAAGHLQQEIDTITGQLETLGNAVAVHTANFANDEGDGTSSSEAYSVGDYLVKYNGLRKVTAPIAVGDPINDSNTQSTKVGTELTALNAGLTWEEILPWTTVSANKTFTFSDTIENYHELLVEIVVNNRITSLLLPVAQITSEPYTSTAQYIISMMEADSSPTYNAYMQFYFSSSTTMVSVAANKTGWTGSICTKVLAR